MRLIKEYYSDSTTPTDSELHNCLEIAKTEHCIVILYWYFPYSGSYSLEITEDMTFEDCKNNLPKCYPV